MTDLELTVLTKLKEILIDAEGSSQNYIWGGEIYKATIEVESAMALLLENLPEQYKSHFKSEMTIRDAILKLEELVPSLKEVELIQPKGKWYLIQMDFDSRHVSHKEVTKDEFSKYAINELFNYIGGYKKLPVDLPLKPEQCIEILIFHNNVIRMYKMARNMYEDILLDTLRQASKKLNEWKKS